MEPFDPARAIALVFTPVSVPTPGHNGNTNGDFHSGFIESIIADARMHTHDNTDGTDATGSRVDDTYCGSDEHKAKPDPQPVTLANAFYAVVVSPVHGAVSVTDKSTGKVYSLTQDLIKYESNITQAYSFTPPSNGTKLLTGDLITSTVAVGPIVQVSGSHTIPLSSVCMGDGLY